MIKIHLTSSIARAAEALTRSERVLIEPQSCQTAPVVFVANAIGQSIVPDSPRGSQIIRHKCSENIALLNVYGGAGFPSILTLLVTNT